VAVLSEKANERIVGMAGVGKLNFDLLPSGMPFASALRQRSDFLELQHVRVAPDLHGYGIGTQLCQTAIQWTQQRGYKMLLVNTTVPQTPALNLYLKLGFQEKARTFVSKYELIWLERNL
jgi:GNAT superfamily N-acetyltransferase